ncbi:MAG: SLBB domain-containing protein [Campylobacterota bacterium]
MFKRGILLVLLSFSFLFSQEIDLNNPMVQEYLKKNGIEKPTKKEDIEILKNLSNKTQTNQKEESNDDLSDDLNEDEKEKENYEDDKNKDDKKKEDENKTSDNPFFYNSKEKIVAKIEENKIDLKDKSPKELKRFGLSFFNETSNEPLSYITPPDDYVLSKGDTMKVSIYGSQNIDYDLTIDRDGSVNIPKIGKLQLENKEYQQAKSFLLSKLGAFYPNSEVFVSISELRTITVTVTGEAKNPGQYNLPALSKVKDALIYSSGITDIGSVRDVKVLRDDKTISNFDLYSLLRGGKAKGDIHLRSGDVVYVPVANKLVKLLNGVKKPAIYELKSGEKLSKLIDFSGGLLSDSIKTAKLKRSEDGKKRFIDISLSKNIPLKDGDVISILPSSNFYENRVTLLGNVYRDESYEISKDESLSQLLNRVIEKYGMENIFMPETDMNYVVVKRVDNQTLESKIFSKNLTKVIDKKEDLKLKSEDKIFIFNKNLTEDIKYVLVEGEVLNEGKVNFYSGMKLIDALSFAGLKKESDTNSIRVISYDDRLNQTVKFYSLKDANSVSLTKYDEIKVSNYFDTSDFSTVTIKGAVNEPGVFQYSKNLDIKDLINYANGLKKSARLDSFELISYKTVNNQRVPSIKKLNLKDALRKNIALNEYDEVIVQEINGWNERSTVTLSGEVLFPGEYILTPGEKISDLIKRAGGFTNEAFIRGAVFTREDVKKIQQDALQKQVKELENSIIYYSTRGSQAGEKDDNTVLLNYMEKIKAQAKDIEVVGRVAIDLRKDLKEFKDSQYDMVLKDGDSLTIPTYEDSVMVIGEVMTQNALTWKKSDDVIDYIQRVGGMKDSANKKGIFVIKANGEAKKVGYSSIFGLSSVDVQRGDVIVVPFDLSQFSNIKYAKDITSVIYQLAVSAASLKTLGAL